MTTDSGEQKAINIAAIFHQVGHELYQHTDAGKLDAILARVPELPSLLADITAAHPEITFGRPELSSWMSGNEKIPQAEIKTSIPCGGITYSIFVNPAESISGNQLTTVALGNLPHCTPVESGDAWKSELVRDIAKEAIGAGIILNPYTPDQSSDRPLYTSCGCRQPKPEPGGTR